MKDNKIILGYPYNCAMYWMLKADNNDLDIYSTPRRGHRYYDTLYGKKPSKYINNLVSLSILFDEILLAPADNPEYKYSQLNVKCEWEWMDIIRDMEDEISFILNDPLVKYYLRNVPIRSREQIIRYSIIEIYLAQKFNASILMNSNHKKILERIQVILNEEKIKLANDNNKILFYLGKNFRMSSLDFSINNLDEFIELKNNKNILDYGTAFRRLVKGVSNETEYYNKMYKIMEQPDLRKKATGILTFISFALSFVSLTSFEAPIPGLASIATSVGSLAVDKVTNKFGTNSSKLLAPEITNTLNETRIRKKIEHELNLSIKK